MANDTAPTCLECDAVIPSGSPKCPACGCSVVYCAGAACKAPFPAELSFCPFCNTPKPAPAATPAPPPAKAPPPPAVAPAAGVFSLAAAMAQAEAGPVAAPPPTMPAPPVRAPVDVRVPPPPPRPLVRPEPPTIHDAAAPPAMAAPPAVPRFTPPAPAAIAAPAATPLLDLLVARAPRKGEQSVVRLRTTLLGGGEQTALELLAECDLFPNHRVVMHAALTPGAPQELPSLKFVPQSAGAEVVRFEATLKGPEGIPLGRWSASKDLIVEDVAPQTGPITAEKGATVIVSAGPLAGMGNLLQGMTGVAPSWQPAPLHVDQAFQLRLRNACPPQPAAGPSPLDASRLWPASNMLHAALRVENARTGQRTCAAVVCSREASFGRGGDPAVAWWLAPAPFDQAQHGRMSRRHTALALRAGRAWVTDHSTNGTLLNRRPIVRDSPELLAQGDSVDPAGVVPLTVAELCVHRQKVHALWVDRRDGWAGRLRYLLTDGTAPVAVRFSPEEPPALWIAWLRGQGSAPALAACAPDAKWFAVPPDKNTQMGPFQVFWRPLQEPCEQEHYLPS